MNEIAATAHLFRRYRYDLRGARALIESAKAGTLTLARGVVQVHAWKPAKTGPWMFRFIGPDTEARTLTAI